MSISRKNKQEVVILLVVGLIIAYIPRVVNSFSEIERPIITSKEAGTLHNKFVQKEKEFFQEKSKVKKKSRYKVPPTKFDPNTCSIQFNINEATLDELKAHPYIDYLVANSIVKLREQPEGFYSIDDILESKLIDYPLFDNN